MFDADIFGTFLDAPSVTIMCTAEPGSPPAEIAHLAGYEPPVKSVAAVKHHDDDDEVEPSEPSEQPGDKGEEPEKGEEQEAKQTCAYCSSRGRVHRRCLRLPSCSQVWKRGVRKRKLGPSSPSPAGTTEPTLPRPPRTYIRKPRQPLAALQRAERMTTRARPNILLPAQSDWPFPVVIPPEALIA